MLVSLENPTVDRLMILARGDLDLLLRAIESVSVRRVADLGDIVDYIMRHRDAARDHDPENQARVAPVRDQHSG